jgi:hypothetical protein
MEHARRDSLGAPLGAAEPRAPAPTEPEGPKSIRVVEVRRHLIDVAAASPDELELVLEAARAVPALAPAAETLRAFHDLARTLQGRLAPLLAWPPPAAPEALDAVLARDLLANPAVRPVIVARGAESLGEKTEEDAGRQIHTRPATRVRATDPEATDLALAAEEPVDVVGFAIDPLAAGSAVFDALSGGRHLGAGVYASSGAFTAPIFAAVGPVRPPEATAPGGPPASLRDVARRGFAVLAVSPPPAAAPEALLRQARAAVNFYLSGAAAAGVFARLAAAVHGEPGASPELLAAVGPGLPVLSETGGFLAETGAAPAGPTWRPEDERERLHYLLARLARTETLPADAPGTWAYDLSPLSDLFRTGALDAYLYVLTEGRESPRLDAFLELQAIRQARAAKLGEVARRAAAAATQARQYLVIIEDKLGAARAAVVLGALRAAGARARGAPGGRLALPAQAVQVSEPAAVLAPLTAREREVVETEYENRREAWEAAVANKCPHVRLARRLRAAPTAAGALAVLRELEPYFAPDAAPRGRAAADAAGRDAGRAPPPAAALWLLCRNCGFRAICAHVRERVRLEARRAPYDEIRTRLLRYAVRVRAGEGEAYAYFCRACSERLAEAFEEEDVAGRLGRFGELDGGLRVKLWTLALGAARHVRFPTPTDERQFASAAADAVYPLVMAAEEAVVRKGRRRRAPRPEPPIGAVGEPEPEELDPRTQLYAALFVYAYVLALIHRSAQAGPAALIGFAELKAGAKESAIADRMLRLVAAEHRGLLAQIEDITAEYLKERFVEAYRLVRRDGDDALTAANPEEELAVATTTVDPIYRYAAAVARVAGDLPLDPPAGPAAARREFEAVLGAPLPALVKQARESAKDPALAPFYLRRMGGEVPPGETLGFLLKGPRTNLYARLYEPRAGAAGADALRAFRAAAELVTVPAPAIRDWQGAGEASAGLEETGPAHGGRKSRPAAKGKAAPSTGKGKAAPSLRLRARPEPAHAAAERGEFFEAYRLFAMYTKALTSQDAFDAYQRELEAFRRSEDGLRLARAQAGLKPYYDFGYAHTQQYVPATVPVTRLYDEDGAPHDWSKHVTYYYAAPGGGGLAVPGGPAGAKKATDTGALTPDMTLVDLECPVCHTRASRLAELDADRAARSLRAVTEIGSFFLFYESRCPEGELHQYGGAPAAGGAPARCRKCGLDAAVLGAAAAGGAARDPGARAYYDKYAATFARERREAREGAAAAGRPAPPAEPARETEALAAAGAWRSDYSLIVRAAELAETTPAVIEAIGAMAGREYADVLEGRGAPPPPASPDDPRIYAADAEVRCFLSDYSTLRHIAGARSPPPALADLLAAAGAPKHELAELPQRLPDLGADYHLVFGAILRTRPPADALAYAIQSLCRLALEVAGAGAPAGGPAWLGRLAHGFAVQELKLVLRGEMLFAKPGSFNWAIFESGDDIVPDQAGDIGEDVLEDLLGAEGEEAPEDPFSGEGMDYDTSENNPNNEPS